MSAIPQVKLLWRNGRRQEALQMCAGLTTGQLPVQAEALALLAEMHVALGRPDEALSTLRLLAKLTPQDAAVWRRLGYAELSRGEYAEAFAAYGRSIDIDPDCARAHNNLGRALMRLDRRAEAIESYRRATQLDPSHATAHNNLGMALFEAGEIEAALDSYRRALAHDANLPEAHHNLGNALLHLERPEDTVAAWQRALQLDPRNVHLLRKTANVLNRLSRFDESLQCCERILGLQPDDPQALAGRGYALRQLHRYEEALVACERALQLGPDQLQPLCTRAEVLIAMGQQAAARDCIVQILERDPNRADMRTLSVMNYLPQIPRSGAEVEASRLAFAERLAELEQWLEANPQVDPEAVVGSATPFLLAYQETTNRDLLTRHGKLCCRLMSRDREVSVATRVGAKVRVAIVSAHIRDHSVYRALVKGWLGHLDRQRLEVGVVHLGVVQDDDTDWARRHSDFFIEGARPLREWIQAIQDLSADVLIYPEIGMHRLTLQLASLRLARHQLAAWGHPETTGLPTIDYYLSAQDFEPPGAQDYYCEKLLPLANLGCYYEPYGLAPAASRIDARYPVLVCAGMPFKYAPQHDHLFPEIARRLGQCTFVFFTAPIPRLSDILRERLHAAFSDRGLEPADYLVFMPWQPPAEFFGLLCQATVMLDTVGFSGFNTIMQAIECALPVAAFEGRFMRGRLGSGIMQRAGLPDLIARTGNEYVELVARLATDDAFRQDVRRRLEQGRERVFRDDVAVAGLAEFLVGLRWTS